MSQNGSIELILLEFIPRILLDQLLEHSRIVFSNEWPSHFATIFSYEIPPPPGGLPPPNFTNRKHQRQMTYFGEVFARYWKKRLIYGMFAPPPLRCESLQNAKYLVRPFDRSRNMLTNSQKFATLRLFYFPDYGTHL